MGKTLNIVWSLLTALLTLATTGLMGVAVLTNHWEAITYSQSRVEALFSVSNSSTSSSSSLSSTSSSISVKRIMDDRVLVVTMNENQSELLVKMHAGLWATCYDLSAQELTELLQTFSGSNLQGNYENNTCLSLQTSIDENDENLTTVHHRYLRLQNLCISSSLVCVIILIASLVVFWVGFILRQVPPVLIVSVLYVLAAVFGSFALSIMRAKRVALPVKDSMTIPGVGDLVLDGQIDPRFYAARSFDPSWSFYIGWIGVTTCLLSSICVYTLSRLMRYPPFLKVS